MNFLILKINIINPPTPFSKGGFIFSFKSGFFVLRILFFLFISSVNVFSQTERQKALNILSQRGEVVIKFAKPADITISAITRIVSIDKLENDSITAYASLKELINFEKLGITYKVVESKTTASLKAAAGSIWTWNKYPTYTEYVSMMDSFAKKNPSLCKIYNIGKSIEGRSILFARINSDTIKVKPSVMYTSSMHGDEIGGYILMLRLINFLISNYDVHPAIKQMVDSLDIWINPLANPDGTYYNGNDVWSAKRYNKNYIDLNRNYPDQIIGAHPDDNVYQPENIVMMNFMKSRHFVLSANFHGGAEVVNYPWDCQYSLHPDDSWFQYISKQYADTVFYHCKSNGYFQTLFSSGITNGAAWYLVYGGRQDYVTYFLRGREVIIELDNLKMTPEANLENLWVYNYHSLVNYLKQACYGIHGLVVDSATGKPLRAKITLMGHDTEASVIYSDSLNGAFYRLINKGSYSVQVSADKYESKIITNINVSNNAATYLNVKLTYNGKTSIEQTLSSERLEIYPNPCHDYLILENLRSNNYFFTIYDVTGKQVLQKKLGMNESVMNTTSLKSGVYLLTIQHPLRKPYQKVFIKR